MLLCYCFLLNMIINSMGYTKFNYFFGLIIIKCFAIFVI